MSGVTIVRLRAPERVRVCQGCGADLGQNQIIRRRSPRMYVLPQWDKADPPRASVPLSTCLETLGTA